MIRKGEIRYFIYPNYGTPDSYPEYTAHSGQQVEVIRRLTDDESDHEMYEIKAKDGWTGHAHADELRRRQPARLRPKPVTLSFDRPHWKLYSVRGYSEWVFRIGYVVATVKEVEPDGSRYNQILNVTAHDDSPKAFHVMIGHRPISHTPNPKTEQDTLYPTLQDAMEAAERVIIHNAHEILNAIEPA